MLISVALWSCETKKKRENFEEKSMTYKENSQRNPLVRIVIDIIGKLDLILSFKKPLSINNCVLVK